MQEGDYKWFFVLFIVLIIFIISISLIRPTINGYSVYDNYEESYIKKNESIEKLREDIVLAKKNITFLENSIQRDLARLNETLKVLNLVLEMNKEKEDKREIIYVLEKNDDIEFVSELYKTKEDLLNIKGEIKEIVEKIDQKSNNHTNTAVVSSKVKKLSEIEFREGDFNGTFFETFFYEDKLIAKPEAKSILDFNNLLDDSLIYDKSIYENNIKFVEKRYVEGKVGQGLYFDGKDDYVDAIPYGFNKINNISESGYTYSLWFKAEKLSNFPSYIFSNSINPSWSYPVYGGILLDGYTRTIRVINYGPPLNYLTDTDSFELHKWYHVAVSYNSTSKILSLFVNGIKKNSGKRNQFFINGWNMVQIGKNSKNIYPLFFNGMIDEVKMWNKTLSENRIKNIYDNESLGIYANSSDSYFGYSFEYNGKYENWDKTKDFSERGKFDGNFYGYNKPFYNITKGEFIFDGVDDYIEFADTETFKVKNKSLSFWIKPHDNKDTLDIFFGGLLVNYYIGTFSDEKLVVSFMNSTKVQKIFYTNQNMIDFDKWQHVVVTFNEVNNFTRIKVYFNNKEVFSVENDEGLIDSYGDKFYLGCLSPEKFSFDGAIANFQFFDKELKNCDVDLLYHDNLLKYNKEAYYSFIERWNYKKKEYFNSWDNITVYGNVSKINFRVGDCLVLDMIPFSKKSLRNNFFDFGNIEGECIEIKFNLLDSEYLLGYLMRGTLYEWID